MDRPKLEVAEVFRRYGAAYRENFGACLSTAQRRVMTAIEVCRTAALGGHVEECDQCAHRLIAYNSCLWRVSFYGEWSGGICAGRALRTELGGGDSP